MKELSQNPKAIHQRNYRLHNPEKIRAIENFYRENNADAIREKSRLKRAQNPTIYRQRAREWAVKNPERKRLTHKIWAIKNKERRNAVQRAWRLANRSKCAARAKVSREKNKIKIAERNRAWREKNLEYAKQKDREYHARTKDQRRIRRQNSPREKVISNCRCRINDILRYNGVAKSAKTEEIIGCTAEFMREFIQHQFAPEMNWDNWGAAWELDHIIPISKFDVSDPVQLCRAFHYSNCKPLAKFLNRSKSNKLPPPHQALLL